MRRFFIRLAVLPFLALGLIFAVANRHRVQMHLDPFGGADEGADSLLSIEAPLFLLLFLSLILGALLGGAAARLGMRRRRVRKRREEKADAALR